MTAPRKLPGFAHALDRQLADLLDPVSDRGGAVVPWPRPLASQVLRVARRTARNADK